MRLEPAARAGRLPSLLAGLLIVLLPGLAAAAEDTSPKSSEPLAVIESVSYRSTDKAVTVRVDLSNAREAQQVVLRNPAKVYYDFPSARLRADQTLTYPLGHKLVTQVRVGQFSERPAVARVVLDLSSDQKVTAEPDNGGKTLLIKINGGAGTPPAPSSRAPQTALTKLRLEGENSLASTLVLTVGQTAAVKAFYLPAPERVVLDVEGASLKSEPPHPSDADGLVSAVRLTQFNSDTVRVVVDLKRPCGYAVARQVGDGSVSLRLISSEAKGRLVIIDPGHGGKDPGCSGFRPGLVEKDVVLDIGLRVRRMLEAKGVRVVMTRDDDTFIVLGDRPQIANQLGAELFVSIHTNAMPDDMKGQRSGTELYWYTNQSSDFADVMLQAVVAEAKLPQRGTHQRAFVVVKGCTMPSVLVETGYLDHVGDGAKLDSPEGRETFARGIAAGVIRYLQATPPAAGSEAKG